MIKSNLVLSRIDAFFDWWLSGLLNLLPEAAREKVRPTFDRLLISVDQEQFTLRHYDARHHQVLEERTIEREDELGKSSLSQWMGTLQEKSTMVFIELPANKVLHKNILLPLNAESSLAQILSFEMDRQTPFKVDQVYFDYVVEKRDVDKEKLHVDLFLVKKELLDPLIDEIKAWNCPLHGVQIEGNQHINLLPLALRPAKRKLLSSASNMMLVACAALFFIMLYVPLFQQQKTLDEFESTLNHVRVQAKQTQALLEEKENILVRTQFLQSVRSNDTPTITIVRELSRILPDNTWLNRLIIRSNEIQLHGESTAASAIIQLIEDSDLFTQAQFRSPVTRNNQSQKDKFHVSAQIHDGQTGNATN